MIFSKDHDKTCNVCEKGRPLLNSHAMICKKKGVVSMDYSCRSFKYDAIKREPGRRKSSILQFRPEDFSIE